MLNFDHNGLMKKSDAPVIERFTHRRRHNDPFGGAFSRSKSIVRVKSTPRMEIHNPGWLRHGQVFVDACGRTIALSHPDPHRYPRLVYTPYMHGTTIVAPHDGPIRLNHYYCKSRQEFEEKNADSKLWGSKISGWNDRCVASWKNGVNDTVILQRWNAKPVL